MSALDQAISQLEEKRAKENAERQTRHQMACAFLKEFYEFDVVPSKQLKAHRMRTIFDGAHILLEKPKVGVYADGMMIVVGEQGEIDVNGKSLGPVERERKNVKKNQLIAGIISHFSL